MATPVDRLDRLLWESVSEHLESGVRINLAGRDKVIEASVKMEIQGKLERDIKKVAAVYPTILNLQHLLSEDERIYYGFFIGSLAKKKIGNLHLWRKDPKKITVREFEKEPLYDIDFAFFTSGEISDDGAKTRLARSLNEKCANFSNGAGISGGDLRVDINDSCIKNEKEIEAVFKEMERLEQMKGGKDYESTLSALRDVRIPGSLFYRRAEIEGVIIYRKDRQSELDKKFETFQQREGLPRTVDQYVEKTLIPYLSRAFSMFPTIKESTLQKHPEYGDFFSNIPVSEEEE